MKIINIDIKLSREFQSCGAEASVTEDEDIDAAYKNLQSVVDKQLKKVLERIEYQNNRSKKRGVPKDSPATKKFTDSIGITETPSEKAKTRRDTERERTKRHMIEGAMRAKQRKEEVAPPDFEVVEDVKKREKEQPPQMILSVDN